MSRVAAIIGDFYHPAAPIREALEAAHAEAVASGKLSIEYVPVEGLAETLASRPDAVILFKEDRMNPEDAQVDTWMTGELQDAIVRYVEQGGGWLAWHSGMASYPVGGAYTELLRGYFLHHPEQHSMVTYRLAGAGHPADGAPSFAFSDEHYFVQYDEARTEVFLRSSSRDGEAVAGWRHEAGEGRVVCLTPAHKPEGLNDPHFQQQLRDCVHWAAGEKL